MKLLCLGNADNVGVRLYSWLNDNNVDVTLYRLAADEDPQRGNPLHYLSKDQIEKNPKIHLIEDDLLKIRFVSLLGGSLIKTINESFDAVVITGGFHALLFSRKIKLPKIFIHVGYEIHYHAAKFRGIPKLSKLLKNPRGVLRNHFYSWLARKSMHSVDKILDWFPPTVAVNKALGFEKKIIYMSFGEDVSRNQKLLNKELLNNLNQQTKDAKKVFLWLSRLNFTNPHQASYKGPDLFIKGIEYYIDQIKSGELMIYMGRHGVEVEEFIELISKSPIYNYIKWVGHLDYPDLLAYLSIKNAVLFTDFGDVNSGISGIGRDGYSVGVPMVNSNTDEIMKKQYSVPGIRYYAKEVSEITKAMSYFLNISFDNFEAIKKETSLYGLNFIDKSFFLKRFLEEINKLIKLK